MRHGSMRISANWDGFVACNLPLPLSIYFFLLPIAISFSFRRNRQLHRRSRRSTQIRLYGRRSVGKRGYVVASFNHAVQKSAAVKVAEDVFGDRNFPTKAFQASPRAPTPTGVRHDSLLSSCGQRSLNSQCSCRTKANFKFHLPASSAAALLSQQLLPWRTVSSARSEAPPQLQ